MNSTIRQKLKRYQELAKKGASSTFINEGGTGRNDGLTKGIRNKEDAAIFMAELKAIKGQVS